MELGYIRTSKADQSTALQEDALKKAGVDRVWTDQASGSTTNRPQLDDLLSHARDGDVVVVWRLDRLGRSVQHLVQLLAELGEQGIQFRSLTEGIDTTTPGGRLIYNVFASLAAFELDIIRERTKAGLDAARARGRVGGRPKALTPAMERTARQMRDEGESVAAIAAALRTSRATIYRQINGSI